VDRSNPTRAKLGICPCLTPSLCAYVTNQGRPVVGIETLALQGIPIDNLLLTRETEENLTSLSGNAMSTTVVGSALVAALLILPTASFDRMNLLSSPRASVDITAQNIASRTHPAKKSANVTGSQGLFKVPLELGATSAPFLQGSGTLAERMLSAATLSAKRCGCESNYANAHTNILRCTACGHCACEKCAGKPEHAAYERDDRMRVCAREFESALGLALPMTVVLSGVSAASLVAMQPETTALLGCKPAIKKRKSGSSTLISAIDCAFWKCWIERPEFSLSLGS